jgi:hypothetical protein
VWKRSFPPHAGYQPTLNFDVEIFTFSTTYNADHDVRRHRTTKTLTTKTLTSAPHHDHNYDNTRGRSSLSLLTSLLDALATTTTQLGFCWFPTGPSLVSAQLAWFHPSSFSSWSFLPRPLHHPATTTTTAARSSLFGASGLNSKIAGTFSSRP